MTKKRSRNIPKKVSDNVKKRHFFECAWCGTNLTDQHHIEEYHLGGAHVEDNLILLCPNCHRQAHQGMISPYELIGRKSNHKKCDRLMGNFKTTLEKSKVVIGNNIFNDHRYYIVAGDIPILDLVIQNGVVLLFCRFYDPQGNLIFWMSRNVYWSEVESYISPPQVDCLEISNPDDFFYLKIQKENDYLRIYIKTYLFGNIFFADERGVFLETQSRQINFHNCVIQGGYGHFEFPLVKR